MKGHRWFAALYDPLSRGGERQLTPLRRFVAGGARGRVLEIGLGTGANLAFYDWENVTVLEGTEPDPFMLARAQEKVKAAPDAKVVLRADAAENLDFPDRSFDTVVSTLVLCTVEDLQRSLAEIRRVLEPDGSLRLLEHVRGEGMTARFQKLIQPAWGWAVPGCVLSREIEDAVIEAGFRLEVETRQKLSPFMPAFIGVAYPV